LNGIDCTNAVKDLKTKRIIIIRGQCHWIITVKTNQQTLPSSLDLPHPKNELFSAEANSHHRHFVVRVTWSCTTTTTTTLTTTRRFTSPMNATAPQWKFIYIQSARKTAEKVHIVADGLSSKRVDLFFDLFECRSRCGYRRGHDFAAAV
jgi:hypothetical protein